MYTPCTLEAYLGRTPRQLPVGHGGVICLAQEFMPLGAAVHAIPVGAL